MKKLKIVLQSNIFYLCLFILLLIYICIYNFYYKHDNLDYTNTFSGIITELKIKNDKLNFILKGNYKLQCVYYFKDNNIDYNEYLGKKVIVNGNVSIPKNSTIPNTFNYKEYLSNNYIYYILNVSNIEIIKDENIFYRIKKTIVKKINSFSEIEKKYYNLFLLGDKNLLDNEISSIYKSNGIWHLFSISGMHISLIVFFLNNILKKIKYKNIIISFFLIFFMFLTNFSASIERTVIFFIISKILEFLKISLSNTKKLFLTAFIILIINPKFFYNTGFQYSFLITLGIFLNKDNINGNYINKIFKMSLISFIIGLPITININYEINLLSVILNIFYVPFISFLVFPISIISFIIPFILPIFKLLLSILEYTNFYLQNFSINIIIPKLSIIVIILYYLIYFWGVNNKRKYLSLLIIILFIHTI